MSDRLQARQTLEALRAGVPSRGAVLELGTTQSAVDAEFSNALEQIDGGFGAVPMVISADFGQGKSHLLRYLQARAERQGFVTSFVVISPETPLSNAHVLLKAIAEQAEAPGMTGKAVMELASPGSKAPRNAASELIRWARDASIPDRFKAILRVYDSTVDEELRMQLLGDLEGRPFPKSRLRQELKLLGEASHYDLASPRDALLAHDRIRLLAQFFRCHGAKGIVVFFDEVERIEKFSFKARLNAYQELGWWRRACAESNSRLLAVFAETPGAVRQCLIDKGDDVRVRSGGLGLAEDRDLLAIEGMDLFASETLLQSTSAEQFQALQHSVRELYRRAFEVEPSRAPIRKGQTTVRSEIRRWITTWDLERHYPSYKPHVEAEPVIMDPTEIADEELAKDDDGAEPA